MLNYAGGTPVTAYNLTRSLRLRASATAYLNRTLATPTNNKIWTLSTWIKRGVLGATYAPLFAGGPNSANYSAVWFTSTDTLNIFAYNSATSYQLTTTQVFRDPSAWYHVVIAVDTTQATAANRVKLYVNGAQVTAFGTATYPALNYNDNINSAAAHYFAQFTPALGANYYDGYIAETNFIDGQALTPSSFGSTSATTGVWQPAKYSGTYGTNGFYLPFTDNSALTTSSNVGLGKDFSGNTNYWTTNNISITAGVTYDSMTDVPTLTSATAANFAVINPLFNAAPSTAVLSNGNLTFTGNFYPVASTIGVSSGKYYFEATVNSSALSLGIVPLGFTSATGQPGSTATSYSVSSTTKYNNGSVTSYGSAWVSGNVIGIALDLDAGTLVAYVNNVSQGTAFSGIVGTYFFAMWNTTTSDSVNFGQRPFAYTPPTGFVALNTYNIPTSTIVKGNTVMDATLYTGTLLSNAITNAASFNPDLVWLKSRSAITGHEWTDSVRGVTKSLSSNSNAAEATDVQGLTAFNSNGFTVGTNTDYNNLAATYVAWQWQAGQGSSAANTNGTITSTVSVNASAGFSVATYTGSGANATVGHGLGVAPSWIIIKQRSAGVTSWATYHTSIGNTSVIYLNDTAASAASATYWNNTSPTSSVFTIGTSSFQNASANTYVAYCWAPIAGFSAFGSYTGNGSANGPFVYTGFRPKFVMIKRTDSAGFYWRIWDSSRATYNAGLPILYPNVSDAEDSVADVYDLLSNGFKLRTTTTGSNASGGTYIYAAFASNPFKNSLAR